MRVLTHVHRLQKPPQFLRRVDIWGEDTLHFRRGRWQGRTAHIAPSDGKPVQALQRAMLAMPKARHGAMTVEVGVDVLRGDSGNGDVAATAREGLEDDRFGVAPC